MTASESSHPRRGVTLVELLIALAILGVLAGVATLSLRSIDAASPDDPRQMLADSARAAASGARTVHVSLIIHGRRALAALGPDGSVTADSAFGVEARVGASSHASPD